MPNYDRIDAFLAVVHSAAALAAVSEQEYVFVYHDGGAWKVTEEAEVWIAQAVDGGALMVHPDGRDNYVEPGNWQDVLTLQRDRYEARRTKQALCSQA